MGYNFPQPISEQIWTEKYRLITSNPGIKDDETVEDTWRRIAEACAASNLELNPGFTSGDLTEDFRRQRSIDFMEALTDFSFLPAGRVTAGAGSGRSVTLFNCYVMGTISDSIAGIFQGLKEAALTMQQGGGIGYDFTPLRPKDSPVKQLDADASGPLTFMDTWDSMCRTIMSAGSRRGAMMATMMCWHPDIEDFITAKHDARRLRMFNLSVMVTEDFMKAVKEDLLWPLMHSAPPKQPIIWDDPIPDGMHVYRVVKAKDLWDLIMKNTYDHAEPGILFIDRINKNNNLWYCETISSTNPCGEQPLPPYGACLLGSLNLTQFVEKPFTSEAIIDFEKLDRITRYAVRMLDSVIDISNFPLPEQLAEAKAKRRMGIGITGLADLFLMLNVRYGSPESAKLTEQVMKFIFITCYDESADLAKLLGPCSVTASPEDRAKYLEAENIKKLPEYVQKKILDYGIRNSHLTSIAPTGTISLYAGNISSGGEPIFAGDYIRKVLEKDGSKREEHVQDYAVHMYNKMFPNSTLPSCFVTAQTLTPMDHLNIQAALQKWVDSSISKTVNLPEDISYEDFTQVYLDAYEMGCKGCTTYRPNDVTGSVLEIKTDKPKAETKTEIKPVEVIPLKRPEVLQGMTYKLKWSNSNTYMTVNNYEENGKLIPFEIFINTKEMTNFQWSVALTRMISAIFRRGGDISFVTSELKSVFDPNGGAFTMGRYVPSFIALLGITLENHLKMINYHEKNLPPINVIIDEPTMDDLIENGIKPDQCPQCKDFSLVANSGCPTCTSCGYSKCS